MTKYKIKKFPKTRVATIDVAAVGLQRHHIAALIEVDVTVGREKIGQHKKEGTNISFTAWLIKVICDTLKDHEQAAGYLKGKGEVVIFEDVHVSMIVEKKLNGQKVPIPLLIENANSRSIGSITKQIADAREQALDDGDIVLQRKSSRLEQLYYYLPGFVRRFFWRYLIRNPQLAFRKMGNVSVTSVGMMGRARGWFIPIAVHPVCFGIGGIIRKPVVVNDEIAIREMLNMTVLLDHDVIDGANMARFISELSENVERGMRLQGDL